MSAIIRMISGPLLTTIVSFVAGGALTALVAVIKSRKKRDDYLAKGMKFLLREDLIRRCDHWIGRGHIPVSEWASIQEENGIYHGLGGNGDLKTRMDVLEHKVMHEAERSNDE